MADTTRELTGRCQVVLAAIAADGTVEDFVTSGMSAAEHATLAERSDGPRLFEHFRDLERPLHIRDLRAFARDLGVLPDRAGRADTIARALEAGAADYVVQPFSSIRADRALPVDTEPHHPAQTVRLRRTLHGLRTASRDDRGPPCGADPTEYGLLRALALRAGRVISHVELVHQVWRGRGDAKLVLAFVKQLRRKLGDDADNPRWISNVRGVGYRMAPPGPGTQD